MIIITGIPRTGTSAAALALKNMGYRIGVGWNPHIRGGMEIHEFSLFCNEVRNHHYMVPPSAARELAQGKLRRQWRGTLQQLWTDWDALKSPAAWSVLPVLCEMGLPVELVIVCRRALPEIVEKYGALPWLCTPPFNGEWAGYAAYGYLGEMLHHYQLPHCDLWYPDWLSNPEPLRALFPGRNVEAAVRETLEFRQR